MHSVSSSIATVEIPMFCLLSDFDVLYIKIKVVDVEQLKKTRSKQNLFFSSHKSLIEGVEMAGTTILSFEWLEKLNLII